METTEKNQRAMVYLEQHKRLNGKELGEALAVNDNHPLWVAVNQMLHDYIRDAIDKSRNPGLVNHAGSMASNSGELDALCTFHEDLQQRRASALEPKEKNREADHGVRVVVREA